MNKMWLGIAIILLAAGTARAQVECGFAGQSKPVQDRIDDCKAKNPRYSTLESDSSKAWLALVARTNVGQEVWQVQDPNNPYVSGLLIGDRRPETMDWTQAMDACATVTSAEAFLPDVKWRLMKADEQASIGRPDQSLFTKIQGNGLWEMLPNADAFFWSSDLPDVFGSMFAYGLDGRDPFGNWAGYGDVDTYSRLAISVSVRCAGR